MNQEEFVALFRDAGEYMSTLTACGYECEIKLCLGSFAIDVRTHIGGKYHHTRKIVRFPEIYSAGTFRTAIDLTVVENKRHSARVLAETQSDDHAA